MEVPLVFLNEQKCIGVKRGGVINLLRSLDNLLFTASYTEEFGSGFDRCGHSSHVSDLKLPSTINVVRIVVEFFLFRAGTSI
ncbi:50S ribosomal protein L25 [Anaplasma phagocytophilum]|nr:50S ribosomal protein L25 [Anaplasma phagocytophilum]